ncbi:MAG: TonB-dependent receptor [Spongiibacteraceae bacterium]|nr:TonB-dependent receptor [Spongiibacteraceae bacterium]
MISSSKKLQERRRQFTRPLLTVCSVFALSSNPVCVSAEGFTLEEVMVTARKRAESLQDTPISMAAFTSDDLNDRQIGSSDELAQVTPNLTFSSYAPSAGNNASSQIFIRGVGQTEFLPTTDPGVGLYIDEVYMARSVGATLDFVDLEQIEILRGPQGTLFGRNTIGGAISITTRKPGETLGGSVELKAGSDNRQEAKVTIDLPVSDSLLTTVSLGSRSRDGYVDRVITGEELGDDESLGGRFAALWDATDDVNFYFTADYVKENESGSPIVFNGLNTGQLFAVLAMANECPTIDASLVARCASGDWDAGKTGSYGTFPVESYFESWGTSLTVEWHFAAMSVKSITAYRDMEWTGSRDADSTPLTILHTRNDDTQNQFSQEFQFSGDSADEKINWLFGLYYFEEEASDDYFVPVAVGTFNSGGLVENDSKAVFGQMTVNFTEQLSLTFGARWTEENKAFKPLQFAETTYVFPVSAAEGDGAGGYVHPFNGNVYPTLGGGGTAAVVPAGTLFFPQVLQKENYSDTTPMINLSYDIDDGTMVYASYSEGFKSGGFNARNIKPGPAVRTFNPELATTYEVGFKADLFDSTLRLNGALFHTDYEDLQFVIREDFAPIVFNAGEAEIEGLELEWTWVPNSSLQIVGGLGYVNAKYTQLSPELQAAGVTLDKNMPHVPDLSANIGIAYSIDLSAGSTLTPRIDWSYRGDVDYDALNSAEISQSAYDLVNVAVKWESAEGSVNVVLAARNVLDEEYKLAGNTALASSSAYSEVVYARGREWSLSGRYSF